MTTFSKATKKAAKARVAFDGPSGAGKTWTALEWAAVLGKRTALIDTERGSASLYADVFDFDTLPLESFHPEQYIAAVQAAADAGIAVLVIDSLSHAWMGKDGALELVDRAAKRSPSGNSFTAWRDVTPLHNRLVAALLAAPMHLIVTMRAKTEYVQEKDDRGKTVVRKVGMQAIQRDGLEYEFTIVGDMDVENRLTITKTRCASVAMGQVIHRPGEALARTLLAWLDDGAEPGPAKPTPERPPTKAGEQATEQQVSELWTLSEHPAVSPEVAQTVAQGIQHGLTHAKAANWIATMQAKIAEHERSRPRDGVLPIAARGR
jgi:hypothetical protein